jgi:hypothetical protein
MGERSEGKGEERQFADVPKFDGKSDWKAFYAKMPCSTPTLPHQGIMMFPTPPPSSVPRRGIAPPPVFPNTFSISRGYS